MGFKNVLLQACFDRVERGVAYESFDAGGVLFCSLLVNAEAHQVTGDKKVPLIYVFGKYQSAFGKSDVPVLVLSDETSFPE